MAEFRGVDFYRIDDLLSEDEKMVRDTVRAFVSDKIVPVMERHFEDATFPMELIPDMAGLGLFGSNLPEEYGCAGMNNVAYGLVMQEIERGDSAIRSFVSVQGALVMYPIYAFGTEEQKRRWLPQLARGEKIGCFGLTEPDHGSDPGGMITRAVKRGDCWVLNGTKSWITNGTHSRCGGRLGEGRRHRQGISRGKRDTRLRGSRNQAQDVAARIGDLPADV